MAEYNTVPLPYTHHIMIQVPESGAVIAARTRGLDGFTTSDTSRKPILVLIHGYPQTSYLWRYLTPLLPSTIPLYIPDIPGYGSSTHPSISTNTFSKRPLAISILSALSAILPSTPGFKQPLILIGHDRGARIIHRLIVDYSHSTNLSDRAIIDRFDILGAGLLDIVPTKIQFESLRDPKVAAGTFHWSFLAAKEPLPEEMIKAYGGGRFARDLILEWSGLDFDARANDGRRERVLEGVEEYVKSFDTDETIRASCADYRAAAMMDVDEQIEDQNGGRRVEVDTLVVYSEKYLGSRYNVGEVWKDWVKDGTRLECRGVGGDIGHFLPEEAPKETAEAVGKWMERLLNKL